MRDTRNPDLKPIAAAEPAPDAPVRRPRSLMGMTIAVASVTAIFLCVAVSSIIVANARQAIYDETHSAFSSAVATVSLRMPRRFAGANTMGNAIELADEVDALRHVAAYVVDAKGDRLIARGSGRADADEPAPPRWFMQLMSPQPETSNFVISHYPNVLGQLIVSSDPTDEVAEVWGDFRLIIPLLLFTGLAMVGLAIFVSRMFLRRISALLDALVAIRDGDLARRSPETHLREFAALGEGIDELASFLAQERQENRKLQKRILTIGEAERAKIAFDLHDEMGPQLFALNIALAQARREAGGLSSGNVDQLIEALDASVGHARSVQARARAAINDLRPMLVGHASLYELISELVGEFSSIAPQVEIKLNADHDLGARTSELAEISIYRFFRESVLNAIRHGHADKIEMSLFAASSPDCHLLARVTDNGCGLRAEPVPHGHGLAGINDRALALGASFTPPRRVNDITFTELRMPCQ